MIAPDEWIYMTQVALIYPAEQPPEGVENGRWIEINIHEQTLAVYEDNRMVFATLVTTGSNRNYTRPGLFKIYEKLDSTHMAANIGDDGAYYLMNGCVNLSFPDADWLYQWADYGDWVYAWDPSGRTPEDPDLFTQHIGGD